MPEKPEVITIAKKLENKILNKKITNINVLYSPIIDFPNIEEFKKRVIGQEIKKITTRGKWILFELDKDYLMFHLRMEGKFFYRTSKDPITKHEHVIFELEDIELRFSDFRKFARVNLVEKENLNNIKSIKELGYEVWDKDLTPEYLLSHYKTKSLPIKSLLLEQKVIAGIGNIYADEILFLSNINPLKKGKEITYDDAKKIIKNSIEVLDKAILEGGTTIRSYTSEEGVSGRFQNDLFVHQREKKSCRICKNTIIKIKVGGRGTYFCPSCQK
ncbi:MAG: bifunctional DNA-formamidopyrimidine glycosylase/DNA-(apurinic or apyrimidinic site) lyase [Bacilli bacterium]|nr:bifunctional DNA-formamidopyrimidine glycosylase/DNA-(apurinic or apyrimidinic site) lyase [Bacilli bacterium]